MSLEFLVLSKLRAEKKTASAAYGSHSFLAGKKTASATYSSHSFLADLLVHIAQFLDHRLEMGQGV